MKMLVVGPDYFNIENIKPEVSIKIQPTHTRFRYECEGSHGSIYGVGSTVDEPIYPTIQVLEYVGTVKAVVFCVTEDGKSHPNRIVCSKKECKHGACVFMNESPDMIIEFKKLGIQCVTKDKIIKELSDRKMRKIDPFKMGFDHCKEPHKINLKSVRLCFQVFREGNIPGEFNVPLAKPIVSEIIRDTKDRNLTIYELSDCSCSVSGGKRIILLCGRVNPKDIGVRFFEESNGNVNPWECIVEILPSSVHMRVAISFTCPPYTGQAASTPVKAYIQLIRPSDKETGNCLEFEFFREFSRNKRLHPDLLSLCTARDSGADLNRIAPINNQGFPQLLPYAQCPQGGNAGPEAFRGSSNNTPGFPQPTPHVQFPHSENKGPEVYRDSSKNNLGFPQPVPHVRFSPSGIEGTDRHLPMNNQGFPQPEPHDQFSHSVNVGPLYQGLPHAEGSPLNKRVKIEIEQTESTHPPIFSQSTYPPVSSHLNRLPVLSEPNDPPVSGPIFKIENPSCVSTVASSSIDYNIRDYLRNFPVTTTQIYTHRFCGGDVKIVSDSDKRNEVTDVAMNNLNWQTETSSFQLHTNQNILTSSRDADTTNNCFQNCALAVPPNSSNYTENIDERTENTETNSLDTVTKGTESLPKDVQEMIDEYLLSLSDHLSELNLNMSDDIFLPSENSEKTDENQ